MCPPQKKNARSAWVWGGFMQKDLKEGWGLTVNTRGKLIFNSKKTFWS